MIKRFFWAISAVLFSSLLLSGCQATENSLPNPTSDSSNQNSDILTRELPTEITAYGVVLAALYIATGEAEEALAAGKVTPDEVYEAKQAIEDGVLDLWRQRAETEIKGLTN
jgi:hypothetical protein